MRTSFSFQGWGKRAVRHSKGGRDILGFELGGTLMRSRTLGVLLFVVASTLAAQQAPDDCSLQFVGTARKAVKLRAPSLAATYTPFGTASAPKNVSDWFAAACILEATRPKTIPNATAMPGFEDKVATLQAYLLAVKFEADGDHDFHMELSGDAAWSASKHVIVEIPPGGAYCTARQAAWGLVKKDAGATPPGNTYVFTHPPLVQVQGFVFYDSAHAVPNGCDDNGGRRIQPNATPRMVPGIMAVPPPLRRALPTPAPRGNQPAETTTTRN